MATSLKVKGYAGTKLVLEDHDLDARTGRSRALRHDGASAKPAQSTAAACSAP